MELLYGLHAGRLSREDLICRLQVHLCSMCKRGSGARVERERERDIHTQNPPERERFGGTCEAARWRAFSCERLFKVAFCSTACRTRKDCGAISARRGLWGDERQEVGIAKAVYLHAVREDALGVQQRDLLLRFGEPRAPVGLVLLQPLFVPAYRQERELVQ